MLVRRLPSTDVMGYATRLRGRPYLAVLDSAMRHNSLGRYSFLCCDPFGIFEVRKRRALWNGNVLEEDPLAALRGLLGRYRQERRGDLPPFQGGALGYVGYEFGTVLESLPSLPEDEAVPQLQLGFYDVVIAIDHVLERAWLLSTGWPEQDGAKRTERARVRADEVEAWLARPRPTSPAQPLQGRGHQLRWESNFDQAGFEAAVGRVTDYVLEGDIFQANIAQRFRAACPASFDALQFYQRLRAINAAPFAAFLAFGDVTIASSSPERFLKVEGSEVETRPIKGTAPRSRDPVEDGKSLDMLLASDKDRAENVMIVDLLRNDLSRVCGPHSVEVPILCGPESYASVHHLVSVVTGRLAPGRDALDLLAACFPGGSVTGAPKLRAMEIIAEIEQVPRGVYCGSIGYFSFDGTVDTNIAIRTATFRGGEVTIHAGGGITLLSDRSAEYEETLTKIRRMFAAFESEAGEAAA